MNEQSFREHILTFIAKSEQWMQDVNKKLDVIDDLQQQVSTMRNKLEDPRESEDEKRDSANRDEETQESDPLLTLAGTVDLDVAEIKKRLKNTVSPKTRMVKGPYEDHPDPLIALFGTLECDVTDIGERHDDYIGDALLDELWGDEDE